MSNTDHDYMLKLKNYCILMKCQPNKAWDLAYEGAFFTMGEFLAAEEERLGVDLDHDSTVTYVDPDAAT